MFEPHLKCSNHARSPAILALAAVLAAPLAAQATTLWTASGTVKVRPTDPPSSTTSVHISAGRNEFEPFQVVIQGPATGVQATATALQGPGTLPASDVSLYREGLYAVTQPTGPDGATGAWPDALIPDVDPYFHEKRSAFPFDVPAGEARAIWVDVRVPPDAAPGEYAGAITVTGAGLPGGTVDVPVSLTVHRFTLPSTPSLKTAFGMWWGGPCKAVTGDPSCGGDAAQAEQLRALFIRAGLDHRISIEGAFAPGAADPGWTHFDAVYGPFLDGTAPTQLAGAKLTEVRFQDTRDVATAQRWAQHFRAKGWFGALFDYTCDEPPATCAWSDIPARAAIMRAADPQFRTLVTTSIEQADAQGVTSDISVMVPVVNALDPKDADSARASYDGYLQAGNTLWWYQSCMSHGCGPGATDPYWAGWPSYAIDASAVRNRAQEWLSYENDVTGELYYETTLHSDTAWTNQFDFGGNGDGTLFYAGRPQDIGGSTPIPVDSIRLDLIREGIEDYEYLKMLTDLGEGAWAHAQVAALFPAAGDSASVSADELYALREVLAQHLDAHFPAPEDPTDSSTGSIGSTGSTGSTGSIGSIGSIGASSTGSTGSTASSSSGGSMGSSASSSSGGSTGSTGGGSTTDSTPGSGRSSTGSSPLGRRRSGCQSAGGGALGGLLAALAALRRRRRVRLE